MPIIQLGDGTKVEVKDDFFNRPQQQIDADIDEMGSNIKASSVGKDMTAGRYISETASNIGPSAKKFGKDIYQAVSHPLDTLENLGNLGQGIAQATGIASGKDKIKYFDAVKDDLISKYGSVDAIKKHFHDDPVGFLADASSVLGFGGAALRGTGLVARTAGAVRTGEVASAAGRALDVASTATNPLTPVSAAVSRVITPVKAVPARGNAVDILRDEGVTVTAGQATGSKFLRKQEEELGGATTENLAARQLDQFGAAVLRRVGVDAPRATPQVVDAAFNDIGGRMNQLAARNVMNADARLSRDLRNVANDYNSLVGQSARAPIVNNVIQDVNRMLHGGAQQQALNLATGVLRGNVYQAIRSRLGAAARRVTNDPNLRDAIYGIQSALDDAMERSIARQNPAMSGQWREARTQYRNLITVEKAVNYGGELAASGVITPQNLARAVRSTQGARNYSRGRGDLQNLARAGSEVMTPLANSNTASRLMTNMFLHGVGGALGAGGGLVSGGPVGAGVGAAIGAAALPRAIGEAAIRGRRYLGNRINPNQLTPGLGEAGLGLRALGSQ